MLFCKHVLEGRPQPTEAAEIAGARQQRLPPSGRSVHFNYKVPAAEEGESSSLTGLESPLLSQPPLLSPRNAPGESKFTSSHEFSQPSYPFGLTVY